MKHLLLKITVIVLSLILVLTMFSACSGNKTTEPSTDEIVDAAVKAALDAVSTTVSVTIEADGKQITIEEASGKTFRQLLDQAGIVLNDGDILSLSPDQMFTGSITLQVLRKCTVVITVEETGSSYTSTILGGTVADALADAGVVLAEYHNVNYELGQLLEDGMEIIVSGEEEPEETEATEPEKESSGSSSSGHGQSSGSSNSGSSNSGSSNSGGSNSGSSNSGSSNSGGSNSGSGNSGSGNSGSGSSGSDNSDENKPEVETKPQKTVVSVQYYDDCDGSGHGVKVITYSDGTQEEVPY